MPTIAQSITQGAALLRAAGIDQERRTAGILLSHVTGLDRTQLLTRSEEQIDDAQYREYIGLVERRAAGEPSQYLTGHQEFYGLDFVVTPDVLIPRPETEFLIDRVVKLVGEINHASPLIVDVGTGSGCIAVTLAKRLPTARLIATDASPAALQVALENADRHGVKARIEFLEGDLSNPLAEHGLIGHVDVLASNPPYVNEHDRELIQREVRDWEPHTALFGGVDGLDFYRRLIAECPPYIRQGGFVVLEIGISQLDPITNLLSGSAFELLDTTLDLQGIPRTICLKRTE